MNCPACRLGYRVGPHGPEPCTICSGAGEVDPARICSCGLPATVEVETNKFSCPKADCMKRAVEKKQPEPSGFYSGYRGGTSCTTGNLWDRPEVWD